MTPDVPPLHGLRVVELDAIGPVPFAGRLLAQLGADAATRVVRTGDVSADVRVGGRVTAWTADVALDGARYDTADAQRLAAATLVEHMQRARPGTTTGLSTFAVPTAVGAERVLTRIDDNGDTHVQRGGGVQVQPVRRELDLRAVRRGDVAGGDGRHARACRLTLRQPHARLRRPPLPPGSRFRPPGHRFARRIPARRDAVARARDGDGDRTG